MVSPNNSPFPLGKGNYSINSEKVIYMYIAGSDESGKGDYFGPLVVAAFTCQNSDIQTLQDMGVKDSKKLTDKNVLYIATRLLSEYQSQCQYMVLKPDTYNDLYKKFSAQKPGLNEMLAWAHSKVLSSLYHRLPFNDLVIDKFGNENMIRYYLRLTLPLDKINLNIMTGGESDTAVACASIIARHLFVVELDKLSEIYGVNLLKGASAQVKALRASISPEILPHVVKMHFKP